MSLLYGGHRAFPTDRVASNSTSPNLGTSQQLSSSNTPISTYTPTINTMNSDSAQAMLTAAQQAGNNNNNNNPSVIINAVSSPNNGYSSSADILGGGELSHQNINFVDAQQFMTTQQQPEGLNISNEIKRLQQMHQLGAGNPSLLTNPSNAINITTSTHQPQNDPTLFFQSMFEQQQQAAANTSINNANRFDSFPFAGGNQVPCIPMSSISVQQQVLQHQPQGTTNASAAMQLPGNFFTDARLLMAQNHFPQTVNFPGLESQQQQQQQQQQQLPPPQQRQLQQPAAAELPLPSPHSLFHRDGSRRMRGGVIEPFPEKLHRLLTEVEAAGRSDVISFVAGGRAFAIHKPDKFFKEIVPLYFRQSRLSSFKRQLNLYSFELINTGPARGGYFHELFQKDHPELCRRMRRVAVKVVPSSLEGDSGIHKEDNADEEAKHAVKSDLPSPSGGLNFE